VIKFGSGFCFLLVILRIAKISNATTIMAAIIGSMRARIVQNMQAPASIVLTSGLAIPPVVAVDNALVATVPS